MPEDREVPRDEDSGQLESEGKARETATVSKEEYDKVMAELAKARTWKENSELLEQLMEDEDLQRYLETKGQPKQEPKPAQPSPPITESQKDDLISRLDKRIAELEGKVNSYADRYEKDQEIIWRERVDREIDRMSKDTVNYPYFKDVRQDMAQLLQTGRVSDLEQAYKVASYDKAFAAGRNAGVKGRRTVLEEDNEPAPKKPTGRRISAREALAMAADHVGIARGETD